MVILCIYYFTLSGQHANLMKQRSRFQLNSSYATRKRVFGVTSKAQLFLRSAIFLRRMDLQASRYLSQSPTLMQYALSDLCLITTVSAAESSRVCHCLWLRAEPTRVCGGSTDSKFFVFTEGLQGGFLLQREI